MLSGTALEARCVFATSLVGGAIWVMLVLQRFAGVRSLVGQVFEMTRDRRKEEAGLAHQTMTMQIVGTAATCIPAKGIAARFAYCPFQTIICPYYWMFRKSGKAIGIHLNVCIFAG